MSLTYNIAMFLFIFNILIILCILKVTCQVTYSNEKLRAFLPSDLKTNANGEYVKFDLDSGDALEISLNSFEAGIRSFVSEDGSDFSIIIHIFTYWTIALFDSVAPYDRHAVGIIRYFY